MGLRHDQGYRMTFDLSQAKIYIRPGPTDMRKQINGLSVIVESVMGFSPFSGNLFLFCGKTKAVLKVLYWDRNGFVLTQKRLEKDRFPWPKDAAPGQPPPSILGQVSPPRKAIAHARKLWRSMGHRGL